MAISLVRTIIIYVTIIVSMRIMGKRQLGELELTELVVAVLISDLASHPLQDIGIPLIYGLVPALTLLCCQVLISGAIVKSARFREIICGKPSIVVDNGKIIQAEMRKNRFTLDELSEKLRKSSILDISAVKFAVLEPSGSLSVIPYPDQMPVTPKQMGLAAEDGGYPVMVINDGRILEKNLNMLGRDRKWLDSQLKSRRLESAEEVYLMTMDSVGRIYFAAQEAGK